MARRPERKVILTAAVTGNIHTLEMCPHLPIGVKGISDAAVAAHKAGASIVHIHAREEDGTPTSDLEIFGGILSRIREKAPDAIISITTGGMAGPEERRKVIPLFRPEMASFNSGSMNFSMAGNPATYQTVFSNSIQNMIDCIKLMNESDTQPEFEIFDFGMLSNVAFLKKQGLFTRSPYFQFVPGPLGAVAASEDNLLYFVRQLRQLFGEDALFSTVGPGRRAFRFETMCALLGGNVRVGMEDSLYIDAKGTITSGNDQQVLKMRKILEDLDFAVATPAEAREILHLKGADKVNF